MYRQPNTYKQNLEKNIGEKTNRLGQLDYFIVTDVNSKNGSISIKRMNSQISYQNVPIIGIGLGNGVGSITMPDKNNIVVCGFIMNSDLPVCLGSVPDLYSNEKDESLTAEPGEHVSRTRKTLIKQDNNGNVIIANENGQLRLDTDGRVTVNNAYTLPNVDGLSGQVLKTDGAGSVTWQDDNMSP